MEQNGLTAAAAKKEGVQNPPRPRMKDQDFGKLFSSVSPGLLFGLIALASLIVVGIGVAIGYPRFRRGLLDSNQLVIVQVTVAAIFGLLAFMLAFTFSLTWSRFAGRNGLVVAQSKALATCYLQSGFAPQEQRDALRPLLREYAETLLGIRAYEDLERSLNRINEIEVAIWKQVATLPGTGMEADIISLFAGSVNQLFEMTLERKIISLVYRIPDAIWSALLLLAFMGMLGFGYMSGITGMRRLFLLSLLPVSFGLIIVLVADLNSTGAHRRFKVTSAPLMDVLELMKKDI